MLNGNLTATSMFYTVPVEKIARLPEEFDINLKEIQDIPAENCTSTRYAAIDGGIFIMVEGPISSIWEAMSWIIGDDNFVTDQMQKQTMVDINGDGKPRSFKHIPSHFWTNDEMYTLEDIKAFDWAAHWEALEKANAVS